MNSKALPFQSSQKIFQNWDAFSFNYALISANVTTVWWFVTLLLAKNQFLGKIISNNASTDDRSNSFSDQRYLMFQDRS